MKRLFRIFFWGGVLMLLSFIFGDDDKSKGVSKGAKKRKTSDKVDEGLSFSRKESSTDLSAKYWYFEGEG